VLRRDHYRCRGCDRYEREVTVAVHLVHPDAEDEQDMLILCRRCFAIVSETKIAASHTPEFLRKLWTVLYAPILGRRISEPKNIDPRQTTGISSTDTREPAAKGQLRSSTVYLFAVCFMVRFSETHKRSFLTPGADLAGSQELFACLAVRSVRITARSRYWVHDLTLNEHTGDFAPSDLTSVDRRWTQFISSRERELHDCHPFHVYVLL
jgi:hypothetical protein